MANCGTISGAYITLVLGITATVAITVFAQAPISAAFPEVFHTYRLYLYLPNQL
jgi:hypothetical protein